MFSGVWLYSWKCSRKPIFISQYPTKKKKKKIIKSEINPKSENNKTRTTHATTTTIRKSKIKKSKWIGNEIDPEEDRPRASKSAIRTISGMMNGFDEWCNDFWVHDDRWRMGLTISGFTMNGDEWVLWFLGSRSKEWVRWRDLSLSLFARLSPSFSRSLSLSLWALLDERARSWVFWVRQSSWMWIDLAFACARRSEERRVGKEC